MSKRKKYTPKPVRDPFAAISKLEKEHQRDRVGIAWTAIENIKDGIGTLNDLVRLKFELMLSMHMANQGLGHDELAAYWEALNNGHKESHEKMGVFGKALFSAKTIDAYHWWIAFYREQIESCNYSMFHKAWVLAAKTPL